MWAARLCRACGDPHGCAVNGPVVFSACGHLICEECTAAVVLTPTPRCPLCSTDVCPVEMFEVYAPSSVVSFSFGAAATSSADTPPPPPFCAGSARRAVEQEEQRGAAAGLRETVLDGEGNVDGILPVLTAPFSGSVVASVLPPTTPVPTPSIFELAAEARALAAEFNTAADVLTAGLPGIEATVRQLAEARDKAIETIHEAARVAEASLKARMSAAVRAVNQTFDVRTKALRCQADVVMVSIEQLVATGAWCLRASDETTTPSAAKTIPCPAPPLLPSADGGAATAPDETLVPCEGPALGRDMDLRGVVAAARRMRALCATSLAPPDDVLVLEVDTNHAPFEDAVAGLVRVVTDEAGATQHTRDRLQQLGSITKHDDHAVLAELVELTARESSLFDRFPKLWSHWRDVFTKVACAVSPPQRPVVLGALARMFSDAPTRPPTLCAAWPEVVAVCVVCVSTMSMPWQAFTTFDEAGGVAHLLWLLLGYLPLVSAGAPSPELLKTWRVMSEIFQGMARAYRPCTTLRVLSDGTTTLVTAAVCGMMKVYRNVPFAQAAGLAVFTLMGCDFGPAPAIVQAAVVDAVVSCFDTGAPYDCLEHRTNVYSALDVAATLVFIAKYAPQRCTAAYAHSYTQAYVPVTSDVNDFLAGAPSPQAVECLLGLALERAACCTDVENVRRRLDATPLDCVLLAKNFLPAVFGYMDNPSSQMSGDALKVYAFAARYLPAMDLRVTIDDPAGLVMLFEHIRRGYPCNVYESTALDVLVTLLVLHPEVVCPALASVTGIITHFVVAASSSFSTRACEILQRLSLNPSSAVAIAKTWHPTLMKTMLGGVSEASLRVPTGHVQYLSALCSLFAALASDANAVVELLPRMASCPNWWRVMLLLDVQHTAPFAMDLCTSVSCLAPYPQVVAIPVSLGLLVHLGRFVGQYITPALRLSALVSIRLLLAHAATYPACVAKATGPILAALWRDVVGDARASLDVLREIGAVTSALVTFANLHDAGVSTSDEAPVARLFDTLVHDVGQLRIVDACLELIRGTSRENVTAKEVGMDVLLCVIQNVGPLWWGEADSDRLEQTSVCISEAMNELPTNPGLKLKAERVLACFGVGSV